MDELIIASPREEVFSECSSAFHGLLPLEDARLDAVLRGLCASPRPVRRGDVEDDPSFKQPIPYIVLTRVGGSGEAEVFAYTRLTGGGERRLHGKLSVGVGGHMNRGFQYETLHEVVWEEAARELAEELCFRSPTGGEMPPPPTRLVGLINDDSGPVQQVHLGLLAVADVPEGVEVTVRETEQLDGRWEPISRLRLTEQLERLEEWSRHALDAFP